MRHRADAAHLGDKQNSLTTGQAARHCGLLVDTYRKLQKAEVFPSTDVTRARLDQILAELFTNGLGRPTPTRKSQWKPFPYTQPIWKEIQGEAPRLHARWRHGREGKSIAHPFGTADWFKEWFACERAYALAHPDPAPPEPQATAPDQFQDHSPSAGQQSDAAATTTPNVVTQNDTIAIEEVPLPRVVRIRRRAAITQADIARIIRAAKQAGAAQIEVRLSDSTSVVIRLEGENALAENDEIVL
jgi:hypothetical protein